MHRTAETTESLRADTCVCCEGPADQTIEVFVRGVATRIRVCQVDAFLDGATMTEIPRYRRLPSATREA